MLPCRRFPCKNRSATGGLPVKHSLQRGLLHLLPESQQTKGPHLSSTAGGHAATGVLLADPFSGFTGVRPDGAPSPLEAAAAVSFSQGEENECFPPFFAAASELAAAALKAHPFECSARI